MILGQTRTSFTPPTPGSFHPKAPHTGFYSGNFWPFSQVMHRMRAYPQYRPPVNPNAGPQMLPSPPPPAPAATQVPSSAPTSAMPATTHGFGSSGFGSTGGVKAHHHHHVSPYMVMREGIIPGVSPSGSNIRAGIHNAGARVRRSMPFQTAPLPPPPPPPPPPAAAPMPAATHGFGYAHGGHRPRRHWLSRMFAPETVAEVDQRAGAGGCETYPPRADGIKVTVCAGRVVKYEDAQGNVTTPDQNSGGEYGSGGMAGFGWHPGAGAGGRWGNRGGGGYNRDGYQPGAMQPGQYPHHRRHHHMWDQQPPVQQDLPPDPGPTPTFGW